MNDHIYDIITKLILGQITEEETRELEQWKADSPRNKQLLDRFLARHDMADLFAIKPAHKSAQPFNDVSPSGVHATTSVRVSSSRWLKLGIAAVALLLAGVFWWHKYTEIIVPQLSDECLAAMTMSQKTGHSDADIVISNTISSTPRPLASATDISDESAFDAFVDNLTRDTNIDNRDLQAEVVTHHDKEFWLTLPDGSRVHLNYGCRLAYPLQFTGDLREVTLEGEAYFMVAKDKRHPFVVHTAHGDVKEYGTEFVVNTRYSTPSTTVPDAFPSGISTSVVLIEGSISVTPSGGRERMMRPSDMALLDGTSTQPDIQQVDTTPFVAWNTGTFAFDNCPLEQLLGVLSRWYNIPVDFMGGDVQRQTTFTGELDRYNDITSGVRAINKVTGLKLRIVDNTIVVE